MSTHVPVFQLIYWFLHHLVQGLTLRFQARGPKRSLDKNKWSKTGFLVVSLSILGPMSEKSRGICPWAHVKVELCCVGRTNSPPEA